MKVIICISITFGIILFLSSTCDAQPAWVKGAVFNTEKATPDKSADALILYHVVEVEISSKSIATTKYQIAYKILSSNGTKFGILTTPIYPFIKIQKLNGWSIKADGSCKSLSKENILTLSLEESAGYYDDSHIVVSSLPDVKPGDIVAFELQTEENGWTSLYQSHIFQEQQPVLFSQFSISIPPSWQIIKAEWRTENIHFQQQDNCYSWTARNLPYQPEEPLAPSWHFLSRRLSVTCYDTQKEQDNQFANWSSVGKWCANIYSQPASVTSDIKTEVQKILNDRNTLEDKIQAIARFCQNDIRYVAVEIGKGRWNPRPATKTLFNRFGDCKDKSTLMRAMLDAINVPSVPVFANVHYPVDPRLPTPFQFNHCIVAIPIEEQRLLPLFQNAIVDHWLFFDPTDPTTQIGEIPWGLQGSTVLIGALRDTILYRLPYPAPQDFRRVYFATAQLNSDLSFSASVTITDYNSWATQSRYLTRNIPMNKQIENWQAILSQTIFNPKLRDLSTSGDSDSFSVSFKIEGDNFVQKINSLFLLRPDFFHNPEAPLLTADERQHPLWFGSPKQIETMIKWELPAGWSADMESTTKTSNCESADIYSKISYSGNMLNSEMRQRQNGRLIWPKNYDKARTFCKILSQAKGQTILLKLN